jgi:hypothetical protein
MLAGATLLNHASSAMLGEDEIKRLCGNVE